MKSKLLILFFLIPFFGYSQVLLKGSVKDTLRNPLVAAQVLVYDSTKKVLISYAITDYHGSYQFGILKYHGLVYVTAQSMGHLPKVETVHLSVDKTVIKNFTLKIKENTIAEVVVKSEVLPIEVKKDTVTYNVSKFTNGSEEVVEDVLKKLPGITVSEDGNITYQGKTIDKVLIENDNLLENYKVLTKNLSASTIKKVQAIENYTENKNLKGIADDDKTVLNLELKNNTKAKPYGDADLSYGYKDFYNIGVNLLGINKKVKYYMLGTSNNIGINSSPNDYISLTTNSDIVHGPSYITTVGYQFPNLKTERVNFNHIYFGSSNLLLKVNDKLKIRNNLYFTKDRNLFGKTTSMTYLLPSGNFTLNEIRSLVRKPIIGEGFLEADYAITNHSNLNYKIKYRLAQTKYNGKQNTIESLFSESLQNEGQYMIQNLDYTSRISKRDAILIHTQYFYNRKSQNYILTPIPDSLPFYAGSNGVTEFQQHNVISEHRFNAQSKYMGVRNSLNFQVKVAYEYKQQSINANLFSITDDSLRKIQDTYAADNQLKLQNLELGFQNNNTWKKWKLSYGLSAHYLTMSYFNPTSTPTHNQSVFLSPLLGLRYKTDNTQVSLLYSSERRYPTLDELFSGYILSDYRTFVTGTGAGKEIRSQIVMVGFGYRDLQKLFMFSAVLTYLNQDKTFGSRILVNKYYTIMEKTIVPGNKNLVFSSMMSKFLPFIYSTVRLNIQLSEMQYYDYLNQSDLRNNKMFSGSYNLILKSGWKKFFNYSVGLKYNSYRVSLENNPVISRTRNIISHQDFIMRFGKKLKFILKNEQFFYDIERSNAKVYYFLDSKIKYTIFPNKLSLQLTGKNLLGNNTFDNISISDYMIQTTQYNLLPPQILLDVTFRF